MQESYSRLAGVVGLMILAMFTWALGNVVLHYAFKAPTQISEILSNISSYFYGAAALFAPYAFNQFRAAFTPPPRS